MNLTLNGEPRELPEELSVRALLEALGRDPEQTGVAVARNLEVVPRDAWEETRLTEGDRVDVVIAVGGG